MQVGLLVWVGSECLQLWNFCQIKMVMNPILVGGFNPFEKYESSWESSPNRDEHEKSLKPSPSSWWFGLVVWDSRGIPKIPYK